MHTTWRVLAPLLVALSVSCYRLTPAPHPPFTITAIVLSIDANAIGLQHKSGQVVTMALTPQTKIIRRGAPAGVADIKTGMRIVVLYHFVERSPTADEVRLFRP